MGVGHNLHGIRNVLAGRQREEHTLMVHRNAVAYADGGELHRGTASYADTGFHSLCDFIQMHMSGNDLILGADHADDGTVQFLLSQAQSPEQGAMRDAVHAAFHQVTSHIAPHFLSLLKYRTLASSMYIRSRSRMA